MLIYPNTLTISYFWEVLKVFSWYWVYWNLLVLLVFKNCFLYTSPILLCIFDTILLFIYEFGITVFTNWIIFYCGNFLYSNTFTYVPVSFVHYLFFYFQLLCAIVYFSYVACKKQKKIKFTMLIVYFNWQIYSLSIYSDFSSILTYFYNFILCYSLWIF